MSPITIRPITPHEAAPVRQAVLRPKQTVAQCVYEHDHDPAALHLGAFDGEALIGVASIMPEACPNEPGPPGYRLRGMAVQDGFRSLGVGGQLMAGLIAWLMDQEFNGILWCNARTPARRFYEREGWVAVGEEFDAGVIGPHYRMIRKVP